MHDNCLWKKVERGANLNKQTLNKFVYMEGFQLYSPTVYRDKHETIEIILRARRIAAHEISVHLGFSERVPVRNANDLDHGLGEDFWDFIRYCTSVNVINMLGSI